MKLSRLLLLSLASLSFLAAARRRAGQAGRASACRTGFRRRIRCNRRSSSGPTHHEGVRRHDHGSLFPSEQLGKAFDHYDMARDGIADLTYVNPGYQPGRFPVIAAGELPFLIADGKGGTAALDAWYRKYAATEMKDVQFCFAFVHDPGASTARKKIVVPADIKGMKIRPAHAHDGGRWSPCSAAPTCRPPRRRRATCWRAASPTPSPSRGARCRCSASTRSSSITWTCRSTSRTFVWAMNKDKYDGDVGRAEEGDRRPLHHRWPR